MPKELFSMVSIWCRISSTVFSPLAKWKLRLAEGPLEMAAGLLFSKSYGLTGAMLLAAAAKQLSGEAAKRSPIRSKWVWVNGPQVLVHVSIYQGKPFWGYPRPNGCGSKNRNSKRGCPIGKWNGPKPAVCPSSFFLSHTQMV